MKVEGLKGNGLLIKTLCLEVCPNFGEFLRQGLKNSDFDNFSNICFP